MSRPRLGLLPLLVADDYDSIGLRVFLEAARLRQRLHEAGARGQREGPWLIDLVRT